MPTFASASGAVLLAAAFLLPGCADNAGEAQISSPAAQVAPVAADPVRRGKEQTGKASWYGDHHHGKKTASGEMFDKNDLTAAHRTLPLGSKLEVTNVEKGRTVEVTVNDRGPFTGGRVIDVSKAAAEALDMKQGGVAPVKVTPVQGAGK